MSRFPSLPSPVQLSDVLQQFGRGVWPLMTFHDEVLRGQSDWSVADRELMAAYVSAVNACGFCHGAHRQIAETQGVDPHLLDAILADPESAELTPGLKAVLGYINKLTREPAKITDADAATVFAAGVSEQALFDAITVCALFNLMNRIVDGCGIASSAQALEATRARHEETRSSPQPYQTFARSLGFSRDDSSANQ
jgi:uncharacterized peroxidase-related enzyme